MCDDDQVYSNFKWNWLPLVILICSLILLLFYSCTLQTKVIHSLHDLFVLCLDM